MSGDTSGKVAIWSMMSQTPTIHSTFQAHSLSLTGLHVMDANHFLTIGNSDSQPAPVERDESTAGGSSNGSKTQLQSDSFTIIPSSSPEQLSFDMSQLSIQPPDEGGYDQQATDSSVRYWEYGKPPKMLKAITDIGAVISSSFHCHNPPGNMFLGLGMHNGIIKIYNVPNFTIASELHFPEMKGLDCTHIRLNLSREAPLLTPAYYRNPFRDLILTSTWSDGKIMVCQVKKQ